MAETSETVHQLGERGTLARILPLLPKASSVIVPPGDDSAVSVVDGARVVTTCDMMIEGPDFRLDWSTPHDLGVKAMASNLADVAAMGAVPTGVIVAVACPPNTSVSVLEDLARGISDGLSQMAPGCGVLGGDLSVAPVLTISVTVIGELGSRTPVLRSGARPGDVVAVVGDLGLSERGLRELLTEGNDSSALATLRDTSVAVRHHLAPIAPVSKGVVAADAGATAMMDISDGLVLDATRMAEASGVTINLNAELADDDAALMGGEDHGLLACFPPDIALPDGFAAVGLVEPAQAGARVLVGGQTPTVTRGGWDPYRDSSSVNTRVSP